MEWYDIEVDGEHTVKFADLPYVPLLSPTQTSGSNGEERQYSGEKLGGIIHKGEWSWLARNSVLHIVSLRNGQTLCSYEFCESSGFDRCCIKSVEEIHTANPDVMLLAVVLDNLRSPSGGGSYVALYSVELSRVITTVELGFRATCARFMGESSCRRSLLRNFDGCLALGSEEGVVVLLDLNVRKVHTMQLKAQDANTFTPCHIVDFSLPLTDIHRHFRQCRQDGILFGLQMEVIESPCSIQCILPIDLIMAIAIGLEDGRMALYDLTELQVFYIAMPNREVTMSPLVKMDYIEPPDDPRPSLYVWTLHDNGQNLYAVMHSLMYEKRLIDDEEPEKSSRYYFESFQSCSVRLVLPLEATKSLTLACQTISTFSSHSEDDSNCLCAISWYSVLEEKNKLLLFDLNQWYKEEMPFALEFVRQPSYLAAYILNGRCSGLHVQLHRNTIAHFNSIQRYEEHFYPNSLSFDCSLLHQDGCRRYNWEGAQNRVINLLRVSNASIFLEPNHCFQEILRARLMPQFSELNLNSTFSKNAKYEVMLSTALENNCVSLLRDCAKSWIDGSFMGDFVASTGLSLSTLTDWIWQRATAIKNRCNDLCKGLFEFGGYPLDHREKKELGFLTRQLKILCDILGELLVRSKKQLPERVYSSLEKNHNELSMTANYQDIIQWLLNIGLLPEASPYNINVNASHDLVPYPYEDLKDMYKKKRLYFGQINENFVSKKHGSCRLLFIDAFIDHACKGNVLHEFWMENDGDGLYPPNSIEAMLRVMLVPDLEYEDKYTILLYFFLDLNMAIDEEAYKGVVANFIKFPSVFKLSAALIKTVQSFWNLDHDQFSPAVDEFISPFNKNQSYPRWMVELIMESLLTQNAANLAYRVLESQPSLISPVLKLKTLLAIELIAEAFHFVRSKNDDKLLELFFTFCLSNSKFGVIRDLALNESEGIILQNILKRSKAPGAESLHLVYLLQHSKYIEAVSYMDEISMKTKSVRNTVHHASLMDTPSMMLSAFNTTMTPVTQGLTDVYFRIKNKIKKKEVDNNSPVPLSCQLIKQNANSLLGGIYHSSALSAHFATYYWGELEEQDRNEEKHLLNANNAPFLRKPQIEAAYMDSSERNNLSYPQVYKPSQKRTLLESEVLENDQEQLERQRVQNQHNPKKKRRLLGQEIVDDLSHFMKLNKQKSITLNANDFRFNEKPQANDDEIESVNSMDMLTRPLASKQYKTNIQELAVRTELQGILKTNTPDSQTNLQDEEKYLRFRLPSIDLNKSQNSIAEEVDGDEKIDLNEETENDTSSDAHKSSASSLTCVKEISRAVSEESQSDTSSVKSSEENFYSPLSSQNNSKLDCSNVSTSSLSFGPKARKPLARLSAEKEGLLIQRLSVESESTLQSQSQISTSRIQESKSKSKESSPAKTTARFNKTAADKQDTNNIEYVTAKDTKKIGISSRKPLQSVAGDMDTAESVASKTTYLTALNTQTSELEVKTEITGSSSGFGSISSRRTLTGSKITEFVPKVSSSTVGSTPLKLDLLPEDKLQSHAKLAECSTVVGSFDFTSSGTNNVFASPSAPADKLKTDDILRHTDEEKGQMLETTLGMSTYDISMLDSTSLQPTTSSLMQMSKKTDKLEEGKRDTVKKTDNKSINVELNNKTNANTTKEKLDGVTKEENVNTNKLEPEVKVTESLESKEVIIEVTLHKDNEKKSNDELDTFTAFEPPGDINKTDSQMLEQRETLKIHLDESDTEKRSDRGDLINTSDEDYIVLSSSSSYIDDNDYGRPFDFRNIVDSDSDSDRNTADDDESEKTFDTGDYDDYTADKNYGMTETEEESMGVCDSTQTYTESNDTVDIIDDISSEVATGSNLTTKSDSRDILSPATSTDKKFASQKEGITSTAITEKTENEVEITTKPLTASITSGIEPQADTTVTTSTTKTIESNEQSVIPEHKGNKNVDGGAKSLEEVKNSGDNVLPSLLGEKAEVKKTVPPNKEIKENAGILGSLDTEEKFTLKIEESDSIDSTDLTKTDSKDNSKEKIKDSAKGSTQGEAVGSEAVNLTKNSNQDPSSSKCKNVSSITIGVDVEKNSRGASMPPVVLNDNTKSVGSPRRSTRSGSIPPISLGSDSSKQTVTATLDKEHITNKDNEDDNTSNKEENPNKIEHYIKSTFTNIASSSRSVRVDSISPSDSKVKSCAVLIRRNVRGTSVPAHDLPPVIESSYRNKRGISVPPQINDAEEVADTPTRTPRRSLRAKSLQTISNSDDESTPGFGGTPKKEEKMESDLKNTELESRTARGSSISGKVSTRRRSVLLDAIDENSATLDSPSAHTRLRSRLNSMDSEADQSTLGSEPPQTKRTRTASVSSTQALALTPKRARRSSISSQSETGNVATPRKLRGRSILSAMDDDEESIPPSPIARSNSRLGVGKRKSSTDHKTKNDNKSDDETELLPVKTTESPKDDASAYTTTSRRLTRTQLAIMEKSVALVKTSTDDALPTGSNALSSATAKHTTKKRSARFAVNDSDDGESISSKHSTVSSAASISKRRVTRNSIKDKDEDDIVSIGSSVGSEKNLKSTRSKDKPSPSSTLPVIHEETPVETKKRTRNTRKH